MSKLIEILTNRTKLMGIAAIGGFAVAGMGYLTRWKIINKFHKADSYKLAVANLHTHAALVNLLGEPIKFGVPDFGNRAENYSTLTESKFTVPLKGKECKGIMLFEASRNVEDSPSKWHLDSLICDVEKTELGKKLKGRVNIPIKYPTLDKVPDENDNDKKNSTDIKKNTSSNSPPTSTTSPATSTTVSTSKITSNA